MQQKLGQVEADLIEGLTIELLELLARGEGSERLMRLYALIDLVSQVNSSGLMEVAANASPEKIVQPVNLAAKALHQIAC
jgi:hypothetical protein